MIAGASQPGGTGLGHTETRVARSAQTSALQAPGGRRSSCLDRAGASRKLTGSLPWAPGAVVESDRIGLHAADAGLVGGMPLAHQLPVVLQVGEWLSGGERSHVGGLGTLAALGDLELDGLAFQPAAFLDGTDLYEHVVAGLGLVKPWPLLGSNHLTVPTGMLLVLLRHRGGIDYPGVRRRRR
jgi:hypothetical protein